MLILSLAFLRKFIVGEQEEPLLLDKHLPPASRDDDRAIHAKEHQTEMHVPLRRPACWTDSDTSPRGEVVMGCPLGVKPGLRNPFHDLGRSCQNASTLEQWETALALTPSCADCARAKRGLDIAAGLIQPDS